LPLVIFGGFGIAEAKFSSVIHVETILFDSSACSARLEEAEGADDALTGLDQVVAGEAGELAQVRDERLVDLGCELVRAGGVDTLVATNGRMHVLLLP
jgi:hypothetical protein